MLIQFDKLNIKNYKCFDDEGVTIDSIKQINVIIGKNNSGKSALIDLFSFLCANSGPLFQQTRKDAKPEIICEHVIEHKMVVDAFPNDVFGGNTGGNISGNKQVYGLSLVGKNLFYSISPQNEKEFLKLSIDHHSEVFGQLRIYTHNIKSTLKTKDFLNVSAERDIVPEKVISDNIKPVSITNKGVGATDYIRAVINNVQYDSSLIEKSLLDALNEILNPDIYFTRIRVQHDDQNIWEIYFEVPNDGWIPLSKMGSGIKTILLVLMNMIVIPEINGKKRSAYVFAFEELENNLHPSLQRRLYRYISEYSRENKSIFFLTTHSNLVIDLFSTSPIAQLFHINKVKNRTILNILSQQKHFQSILEDLEIRASDILQSNGIIWVEGPSDRTYLKKWMSLVDNTLSEGAHYSIMFYGGKLLSNLSFETEFLNTELIPLLKLNRNAHVVMDRDAKGLNAAINTTKSRIQEELGEGSTWITDGREIENYLSDRTLNLWLSSKYCITKKIRISKFEKLETNIAKLPKANKLKYDKAKNRYSAEISEYITFDDMSPELREKVQNVVEKIRRWNQ
jgi:putative ATP-dependent endonuclease of OLD family